MSFYILCTSCMTKLKSVKTDVNWHLSEYFKNLHIANKEHMNKNIKKVTVIFMLENTDN